MKSNEFIDNIEFSEDWLMEQILKSFVQEKKSGKVEYVRIKKIDLYKLVQQFIKLNKEGEL